VTALEQRDVLVAGLREQNTKDSIRLAVELEAMSRSQFRRWTRHTAKHLPSAAGRHVFKGVR
jgi:hypothetical protein